AVLADAAGIDRLTALAVGSDAIQSPRDDARCRCLADAAHAGEHEGMRDAPARDGVAQSAHHRLLTDQGSEIDGAVLAGEDAVGKRFLGARHTVVPPAKSAVALKVRRSSRRPAVRRGGARDDYG